VTKEAQSGVPDGFFATGLTKSERETLLEAASAWLLQFEVKEGPAILQKELLVWLELDWVAHPH